MTYSSLKEAGMLKKLPHEWQALPQSWWFRGESSLSNLWDRVVADTVAKFIWLPIESAIQAHFVEMHIFSSSQENEFSNSIRSASENHAKLWSRLSNQLIMQTLWMKKDAISRIVALFLRFFTEKAVFIKARSCWAAASGSTPFSGTSSHEEENHQKSTYGRIEAEKERTATFYLPRGS